MKIFGMHLYQLIVLAISGLMITQGVQRFTSREKGQTILKLFARLFVWGGISVIVLFPKITYSLASFIGITGNINAVILAGFLLVFLIIFKILSTVERLEQNISELTRKESLKKLAGKMNQK